MGEVYLAENTRLDRKAAFKVFLNHIRLQAVRDCPKPGLTLRERNKRSQAVSSLRRQEAARLCRK